MRGKARPQDREQMVKGVKVCSFGQEAHTFENIYEE
jgi:hypothetical protein